jgi:transposase
VPRPYPREFRDDVVRVARDREAGVTIEQVAGDFGVHPMTLQSAELREARKRIRLLEQENEVLRRATAYLSQADLPGNGSTRS